MTITVALVVEKHPLAAAIIVKVVVCGVLVPLFKIPAIFAPIPTEESPVMVAVLFLVQVNIVPATLFGLVLLIGLIAVPEQTV